MSILEVRGVTRRFASADLARAIAAGAALILLALLPIAYARRSNSR